MFCKQIIAYEVYDAFGLLMKFDTLDKAERFCYNKPDCVIKPVEIDIYELLGECLL